MKKLKVVLNCCLIDTIEVPDEIFVEDDAHNNAQIILIFDDKIPKCGWMGSCDLRHYVEGIGCAHQFRSPLGTCINCGDEG